MKNQNIATVQTDGVVTLDNRSCLPAAPGVYFVCDADGNVLYVGRSVNMQERWRHGRHHRYAQANEIEGVCIAWKSASLGDVTEAEYRYIEELVPEWNGTNGRPSGRAQKPVKIDEELHQQLQEIQDKDGVPIAESVRRAIKAYLERRKTPED